MKTDLGKCKKLIDSGLSILTVGNSKVPNFPWKKYQAEQPTKSDFEKNWLYAGGIIKKDGREIEPTTGVGIITGYNGLEVIDIDLKVFKSLKEQQDFWNELTSFLRDNIDEFDSKFVIYKTVNSGYHILYRCVELGGNEKIAKLKGHEQAIIETRGVGGYVFIYDNQVSKKSYFDIQEISTQDRDALFGVCKYYNYVEDKEEIKVPETKEQVAAEIKVWDDYNSKESILDIVGNDFTVVNNLSDKYIIRRAGATTPHSGYIYKDSGCMYLFSTGTIYPHEKLHSPFAVYTYKYCEGDFSRSAKELYAKGYGSRILREVKELETVIPYNTDDLVFPLDIFPDKIQNYITLCNSTLDSSIDYMGCSMLWMISVIIGNSMKIQVKVGWYETCNIWIAVVGKTGIGKTPSISNVVFPLMKANSREIKKFVRDYEKYQEFMALDKKDRANTEQIKKPIKTQFVANDVTLEALVDMHEENKNAVAVFKDEMAGWFKDMNKYREGSDLEFWLSTWSGKTVSFNRKTAKSSFIESPLIPVLGGIQPTVLDSFYTEENKDNGFIDRMLLCYPDLMIDEYQENELSYETVTYYSDYIVRFYDGVKNHLIKYNNDDEIEPILCIFSPEAKIEWKRIFNEITAIQNSDEENEYMKSMLPKQKSYIPRFALVINTFMAFHNGGDMKAYNTISKDSILAAERLSKYFIAMAKKIKVASGEVNEIKKVVSVNSSKPKFQQFEALYKANPNMNKKEVAEALNISRVTVYDWMKKCKESVK